MLKENGEDIASDSVIKSLSIQLKSAKDQLEEFNQEYEKIVSTHRAVAQEVKVSVPLKDFRKMLSDPVPFQTLLILR